MTNKALAASIIHDALEAIDELAQDDDIPKSDYRDGRDDGLDLAWRILNRKAKEAGVRLPYEPVNGNNDEWIECGRSHPCNWFLGSVWYHRKDAPYPRWGISGLLGNPENKIAFEVIESPTGSPCHDCAALPLSLLPKIAEFVGLLRNQVILG